MVKLKVGFLNSISSEWFSLYSNRLEQVNKVEDADFIIYESNGDPIHTIMKILNTFPKNKLVFILSGDQNCHIDDEAIWFSNAISPHGLARMQTQIFVTNPAIFKFYRNITMPNLFKTKPKTIYNIKSSNRSTNIYFKGTIWTGMRTEMYRHFINKSGCKIIENNGYWSWRLNNFNKPTQEELEANAFETYNEMLDSKLVLCPKGNGNSSMRIIEALGCGAIPVLINDFSEPFGVTWSEFGLVFNTERDNWNYIYNTCCELINDLQKLEDLQRKGMEYFEKVIFGDNPKEMYKDINTVCYGFSHKIIEKLEKINSESK